MNYDLQQVANAVLDSEDTCSWKIRVELPRDLQSKGFKSASVSDILLARVLASKSILLALPLGGHYGV